MFRKITAFHFLVAALLFMAPIAMGASDQIQSLIDFQQKEIELWSDSGGDLPPTFLLGDSEGIRIFSDFLTRHDGILLCQQLILDEVLDRSGGNPEDLETVLNIALPRVREVLGDNCLVRPNDVFSAVGDGWQQFVVAHQFLIKKEKAFCPKDSPYSLWISFKGKLPGEPIFFYSGENLQQGQMKFLNWAELEKRDLNKEEMKALKKKVSFLEDYSVEFKEIKASTFSGLAWLTRTQVTMNDTGLPNSLILYLLNNDWEIMELERVDPERGSGTLEISGLLDFNADGILDYWIKGIYKGCPYSQLFMGLETGVQRISIPNPPCGC